ncbi:NAD(+) diphosphatase [Methylobacterium iners]|uniref:NAD(+) diphosphatase n=1 Tax=Methylobacterium iners TaxID=418707 RepID=A0ABQ4S019_9HYPH|nr:NAD(+) diphosphatase [Methylobacterium iners]GJD95809.1 NADH pyrophosphatase [Methylobacterium iners]
MTVLGYAQSRLVRHSAERGGILPSESASGAALILITGERILLAEANPWQRDLWTALLDPARSLSAEERTCTIFLGHLDGRPVFAASAPPEAGARYEADPAHRLVDLRSLAAEGAVAADELGLLATAKSLLAWHASHGFCSRCGAPTAMASGGYKRICAACEAEHFPRTDPVVIMLITQGESCLLGRAQRFPEGMYSCLAGFLEPGETIEAAVARETFEEVGIRVGAVRYLASQPWPFPSSLMIGCVADALDAAITIDPVELADARWFTREAVAAMIARDHPEGLSVPPPMAIAHLLMRAFVDRTA